MSIVEYSRVRRTAVPWYPGIDIINSTQTMDIDYTIADYKNYYSSTFYHVLEYYDLMKILIEFIRIPGGIRQMETLTESKPGPAGNLLQPSTSTTGPGQPCRTPSLARSCGCGNCLQLTLRARGAAFAPGLPRFVVAITIARMSGTGICFVARLLSGDVVVRGASHCRSVAPT